MPLDNSVVLTITLVLGLGAGVVFLASRQGHDPREPPLAKQSPPFIGHLLGLLCHGNSYLEQLTERSPLPIFTVPLPGSKMYLVKDPDIAALVHRNARTLSFVPIVELQTSGTCSISPEMWDRLNHGDPDKAVSRAIHKSHHANLAHTKIYDMHERSFAILADGLNSVKLAQGPVSIRLREWLRPMLTEASAASMYGAENPVAWDKGLIEDMANFEKDEGRLFLGNWGGFLQPLIAPKGYKAMKKYGAGFNKYYESGLVKNASPLIQDRFRLMGESWDHVAIGSLDILMVQAALMNMMAMKVWLIWHLFADATLLAEVRGEVLEVAERKTVDGVDTLSVDGSRILSECPLLMSTWMELLRYYASAPSARFVSEDTVLENGILLKKNCVIQLMGGVMHTSEEYWGPDVESFQPRRFLKESKGSGRKTLKRNKAYMPFGGGIAYCPGRHYVSNETLAFASALVIAFEIKGKDGPLRVPEYGPKGMIESIRPPISDPLIELSRRPDFASTKIVLNGGVGVSVDLS